MATIKRIVMLGSLLFGALTFFGPAPAEAHTGAQYKDNIIGGCLQSLHRDIVGSLTGNFLYSAVNSF